MITVEQLAYTYPGRQAPAVRGLDFTVAPGEIFGFLGPSGAGKSTTQKILVGLLRGYAGNVQILGRDLSGWGADLYEEIGISFEIPTHYLKLTALENLRYFGALYGGAQETPESVLEWVGLAADAHVRVGQFSKGMRNRLNLARALLHRPRLLFLDEPTAGLDPVNARRVRDLIRSQQAAGRTVFLTTHNMSVADELCDRVAFIVDGEIRLIGSPRELKLRYGERSVRVEYGLNGSVNARHFPLDRLADNAEFLDLLRANHIQTIHTLETSLEDVFIAVTGRRLLDAAEPQRA